MNKMLIYYHDEHVFNHSIENLKACVFCSIFIKMWFDSELYLYNMNKQDPLYIRYTGT